MVSVARVARGDLRVGGPGEPVDWLVHMRRVPTSRTLVVALLQGWATRAHLDAVGCRLAAFYAGLPLRPDPDHVDHLRVATAFHAGVLRRVGLDPDPVLAPTSRFLETRSPLLQARGGHLVDGHGDLRAEHVLLVDPPLFIDALDLPEVRVDPVDELGYLALECERLGAPWARAALLAPWLRTGDLVPDPLIDLYQAFRAGLRACLYALRIEDGSGDPDDLAERARAWLRIGAIHAAVLAGG